MVKVILIRQKDTKKFTKKKIRIKRGNKKEREQSDHKQTHK